MRTTLIFQSRFLLLYELNHTNYRAVDVLNDIVVIKTFELVKI